MSAHAGTGFMRFATAQARLATRSGDAFGPRSSAASSTASGASTLSGSLPNNPRAAAEMPRNSPRNGARLKYASSICALFQRRSMARAAAAWSHFCPTLRRVPMRRSAGSMRPASCIVSVDAPRGRRPSSVRHRLSQVAPARACQSTPECSRKRLSSATSSARTSGGDSARALTQSSRRSVKSTRTSARGWP